MPPAAPPAIAPAAPTATVEASQPAATTGPMPGIASTPRPASNPAAAPKFGFDDSQLLPEDRDAIIDAWNAPLHNLWGSTEIGVQAVGCAHCGWRGLAAGVLEATVRALGSDAGEIDVWLGPAIGAAAFEVGEEVRAAFLAHDARAAEAFTANARGRWQCDLAAIARQRLAALGVHSVFGGDLCTYSDAARFYSYRRDGRCGRMAALIWLTGRERRA